MLLKIKRAQKSSMMGNALFSLDFRAEFSREERELIDKYKLGKMIAYSSESYQKNVAISKETGRAVGFLAGSSAIAKALLFDLKITVNDLVGGRHIEMKDLDEMLSAENQIVQACHNMKGYLAAAKTFDGREDTIEI
jgi:hypothetical protein